MGGRIDYEMDKISNLPDFILHRILGFLPTKDATRSCILSKRWSSIWDSFPIFDFYQRDHIKGFYSSTPEYMEKVSGLMDSVDKSLQKFVQKKLRMEKLSLAMPFVDHKLVMVIDGWILLALNNGVQEISLRVSTDLAGFTMNFYNFPEKLFAVKSLNGSSKFDCLQHLSLQWVHINENVIRDMIHYCPNMHYFSLKHFRGLKTIKISKLDKLESVSIVGPLPPGELDNISIDAPKLKYFCFNALRQTKLLSEFSLAASYDLKELRLCRFDFTDDLLHLCLSRFPFLENLEITRSPMLRSVRISGQQLKTLHFCRCENIEIIQIDAPSLSVFKLITRIMPVLASENVTCPMEIEYEFESGYGKVKTSWFIKLRKFLEFSPRSTCFTLYCIDNEVCFDLEELGQVTIPPAIKIDHLKITSLGIEESVDCANLIDGLLWSCHPMTISVPPGSMFQNNCVKVLCEKLLDNEHVSCCKSSNIRCWRHDLKAVKIESFGGIEDERLLHLNLLLDTLPLLTEYQEIRFNLEWEC